MIPNSKNVGGAWARSLNSEGGQTITIQTWRSTTEKSLERRENFPRHVFSAAQIGGQRGDRVNRSPGDSPPSQSDRQDREGQSSADAAFTAPHEVNRARPQK